MNFYEAFVAEMEKVTVMADAPATAVYGACLRAAHRAQSGVDGESVSAGPWVVSATAMGTTPIEEAIGVSYASRDRPVPTLRQGEA